MKSCPVLALLLNSALEVDNRGERHGVQAGAAHQDAVDLRLRHQDTHVVRLDAAAVEDADRVRGCLRRSARALARAARDGRRRQFRASRFCLCRWPTPVRKRSRCARTARGSASAMPRLNCSDEHGFGFARFALLQALAHAHDGRQSGIQRSHGPLQHGLVGLLEILAPFAVPDQHVRTPAALIIGPETSPVKAPSLAQYRSCAPMPMRVPSAACDGRGRCSCKAGRSRSRNAPPSQPEDGTSQKTAVVSAGVLYIFQLPAMIGFLI